MRASHKQMLLVALVLVLGACSEQNAPAETSAAPGAAEAPAAAVAIPEVGTGSTELADFTVTPGHVFACEGRDHVTSTLKWLVKDPTVVTVKVLVGDRGTTERKTFAASASSGEAVTGNWVGDGTHFYLVDGATGKELASYEVPSHPCT